MPSPVLRSLTRWLLEEALEWVAVVLLLVLTVAVGTLASWVAAAVLLPVGVVAIMLGHRALATRLRERSEPIRNAGER